MKELRIYKVKLQDGKSISCLSVKELLLHLQELDVLGLRDEKSILATLVGELLEVTGLMVLPKDTEVKEPPMMKRGVPVMDDEIPRPAVKKIIPQDDIEEEPEEETDEKGGGEDEEFSLR